VRVKVPSKVFISADRTALALSWRIGIDEMGNAVSQLRVGRDLEACQLQICA
jgi:hypothetical protein